GIFSVSAFIVSVIYLSRFKEISHITLHACTWRPLFLTSLLLADKMWVVAVTRGDGRGRRAFAEDKPVRRFASQGASQGDLLRAILPSRGRAPRRAQAASQCTFTASNSKSIPAPGQWCFIPFEAIAGLSPAKFLQEWAIWKAANAADVPFLFCTTTGLYREVQRNGAPARDGEQLGRTTCWRSLAPVVMANGIHVPCMSFKLCPPFQILIGIILPRNDLPNNLILGKHLEQQLVGMVQAQQEHVAKSLVVHARDVAKVGGRADALVDEQRRIRAQIDDIEKTLANAEKEIPIIDFQALEAWSRLLDARIFSVGAPELVGPAQVRAGISDWLTAAGLDNSMVRLDSSVPSQRFNVVVEGVLDIAIPRAHALARHVRNPAAPNGWRSFQCQAVGGGTVPLYVVPDQSPQQVRMNIQTRRLANILSESVPGQAFCAQRARGTIASQGVRLAKLEMGDRRETDTTIRWNMDMVSRLAIDRGAIAEQFKKAFSLEHRDHERRIFDLSDGDFAAVEMAWNDALVWAADDHLRRIFIGAGDFNIADSPAVSQWSPVAEETWRLRPDQRYQLRQPAWRRPFAAALEIEAQWPARYDKASQQLSVIDRVFLGIDAHAMLSVSTRLATACDAMELSELGLRDHAPLVLQIEMARHVPREEQAIPSRLFFHPKCPETSSLMMTNCDLEAASVEERRRATETCVKLAAARIRDEQLRTNSSLKVKGGNVEATCVGLKTAARALWRQDALLAARLLASCPDLSARLPIDQGSVRVADASAFAEAFDAVAAKVRAMRGQAAEAAARRSNDRDSLAWRRVERRSARHVQLWIPWRRRMVLAGLRLDSAPCASGTAADVPPEVASDSAGMTGVVAEHWGKIFDRAPTAEQKLRPNQFLDRFAPQLPVVELPQPSLRALGRAAARAPPSAPGPDQLPCAAWRRSPGALLHLHALMEQLFNEGNAGAKLIASCADRALRPIASVATEGVQKGFAAGRRFVGHVPSLGAECRREGLLPGAAQHRPMLLSFDFKQAFPSLFRDVIDVVLPRCGVPLGYCSAISALCCNCLAFGFFRVSGGSAAKGPLFALRCGIMQGCPLSGTALGDPPEGCLAACAGDLGMLIRNAEIPPSIAESFVDIELAFNLQLAIHKCVLVPLWAEVAPDLINDAEAYLAEMVPSWRGFRVESSAKYLGTRIGPGIAERGIWKDSAAKWRSRAAEMSRAGVAASLAARAYNVNVLPCLSYLAQLFFVIPEIWRVEVTMLNRLLRFPPSAMRMADIPSMGAWCGSPAPMGLLPCSVAALLRAAAHAVRGWVPALHALRGAAVENLPLVSVLEGSWSPPWWATKRSIVQNYGLVMEQCGALPHPRPVLDKVPVPVTTPLVEAARSAMGDEEKAAARAVPPGTVKRQAVAMRAIRDGLYEERLDQLIGRRLRRWGLEVPAGEVHVIAHRPCIMGCEARGALSHYMACPVLRSAVAAPAEASELSSGATFFGLGHMSEHRARLRIVCVRAVALATQLFHILKWRADGGSPIRAAAIASARVAALHRLQA
ncbi:unnamed protein product, partial [Prorocentrum cordatum]